MNIPQIMGLRLMSPFTEQKQQRRTSSFGLTMAQPLLKDTVSFGATAKMLTSRKDGVSLKAAREVYAITETMQPKIQKFLNELFGDLQVTQFKPQNPIYKISDRAKTPESIREKSATRQWNCRAEILDFMTDLNGAKIVMRDGSKKSVEKVLSRFIEPIKKGKIELIEIENKRPKVTQKLSNSKKSQYDYASIDFLEQLQRIQEDKWASMKLKEKRKVRTDMFDFTEVNYPAIHILFKLPGEERPFELMIMGKNVNAYKDLDDKLFKILNNKNIDKKYKPLVDVVSPLSEPGNKPLLELFNKYRGDAFLFQRAKKPTAFSESYEIEYFLPLTEDLPPQYDLNNLHRIMQECEAKAAVKQRTKKP